MGKEKKKTVKLSIRKWPEYDRPREKLLKFGEHTLTNAELLAILLRTGSKDESALDISRKIIKKFRTFRNMANADMQLWNEFKGIGKAKLAQIKAAIEIGRRFGEEEIGNGNIQIKSSRDAVKVLMPRMRDLKKEVFKVLFLDSKNRIIENKEIEAGIVNQAMPYMRKIFELAFRHFASSIICAHNHPSGDPAPSIEDKMFTKRLKTTAEALNLKLLDHIIIGDNSYFSFSDEGII